MYNELNAEKMKTRIIALCLIILTVFVGVSFAITCNIISKLEMSNEEQAHLMDDLADQLSEQLVISKSQEAEIEALKNRVKNVEDYTRKLEDQIAIEIAKADDVHPNVVEEHSKVVSQVTYSSVQASSYEREMVERVVQAEAGDSSEKNIKAVAQCMAETAKVGNKSLYTVACKEGQYTTPASKVSEKVHKCCVAVFDRGERVVDEPIRFFYSIAGGGYSKWHETSPNLEYVCTISDHKYFKIKGT